jgi:uncharacterized protein
MFLAMKTAEQLSPAPTACPGDATAQFNLGAMYYYAQGVAQDYAAALSWFRKAVCAGPWRLPAVMSRVLQSGAGLEDGEICTWRRGQEE